ncbi:MAG TPA: S8 family serine peptidase [Thermoanaerobaculia bacterium]|nr:S8 family serine peptidase [Thermoanaerobaculia bacterium]
MPCTTYTYQSGKKLELSCSTTHFVSRAEKQRLLEEHFSLIHALSPHSWCVRTSSDRLHEDLVRARLLGPAYPAYVVASSGAGFHVTDRVALRFRCDVSESDARQFGDCLDLQLVRRLTTRDVLFRVRDSLDAVDVVRNLTERNLANVEFVEHDLNIRPQLQETIVTEPDATEQQWHLFSTIDNPLVQRCALLDCEGAWEAAGGYGHPGVIIGVVDSGCDLTDPNFGGPEKFADWAVLLDGQLLTRDNLPSDAKGEIMNPPRVHGTLCATLTAATADRYGGLGVAPNCRLLPVKLQDFGGATAFPESLFFDIIRYLRDKVDVVSNSWARGANGQWPPYIVDELKDAALNGGPHGNGMVWVWAAGNRNCPIQYTGDVAVPITVSASGAVKESSKEFVNSLAGLPGVVHVGAISSLGQRCHYSNYGDGLDLVAPSGNHHTYGRGMAKGIPVWAPLERGLRHFRGTSAAAPLVAGVAGLVRSVNPRLTSTEIVSVLRRTADKNLDFTGYDPSSRPSDPDPAWDISPIKPFQSGKFDRKGHPDGSWSAWFGFGKVNARNAVEEALRM